MFRLVQVNQPPACCNTYVLQQPRAHATTARFGFPLTLGVRAGRWVLVHPTGMVVDPAPLVERVFVHLDELRGARANQIRRDLTAAGWELASLRRLYAPSRPVPTAAQIAAYNASCDVRTGRHRGQ